MTPSIVKAEKEHILHIAANVRDADKRELWDYMLLTPLEALHKSIIVSPLAWTGMADEVPVCMFGCAPASVLSTVGRPWMIGTTDVDKYAMAFLRRNKRMVKVMMNNFDRLENFVDVRNVKAIEWLKWLSFEFGEVRIMGPFLKPFQMFYMEK